MSLEKELFALHRHLLLILEKEKTLEDRQRWVSFTLEIWKRHLYINKIIVDVNYEHQTVLIRAITSDMLIK